MDYPLLATEQLSMHLRSIRKARGLTQAQLGERLGLNQARIGKIERDPANVSTGQLLDILAVLGVRVLLRARETPPAAGPDAAGATPGGGGDW